MPPHAEPADSRRHIVAAVADTAVTSVGVVALLVSGTDLWPALAVVFALGAAAGVIGYVVSG